MTSPHSRVKAVSNRVTRAYEAMVAGETEEALFQICSATENTLRREDYEANAKGYKAWLLDSTPIITGIGFGRTLAEISFGGSPDRSVETISLQHLLYKLVRCGLYHQGQLEPGIIFTDNSLIAGPPHGVPKSFVIGLIFAVVASPCNFGGQTKPGFFSLLGLRNCARKIGGVEGMSYLLSLGLGVWRSEFRRSTPNASFQRTASGGR